MNELTELLNILLNASNFKFVVLIVSMVVLYLIYRLT